MRISLVSLVVVIAGALMVMQAGVNFRLSQELNNQVLAALISFAIGTIGLLIYFFIFQFSVPTKQTLFNCPWWIWLGGVCGAFYVLTTIIAVPTLGATVMFTLFLTGQMTASIFLDHYGLIGFPAKEISMWRIIGIILVVSGTFIIKCK